MAPTQDPAPTPGRDRLPTPEEGQRSVNRWAALVVLVPAGVFAVVFGLLKPDADYRRVPNGYVLAALGLFLAVGGVAVFVRGRRR